MALPSVLHDFDIQLSHVDRAIEQRLLVKAARHPSESPERLWLRLLAYCLHYREGIAFGPGLCEPDQPDLHADDLTGERLLWVRVGKPDPARLQREADRASRAQVAVLFESPARLRAFAEEARSLGLARLGKVDLAAVEPALLAALAARVERRNRAVVTIVGDHLYLEANGEAVDGPLTRINLAP